MRKLIPDYVFESVYEISPAMLRARGVRGVLIDLDGTMASCRAALPPEQLHGFIRSLREGGMQVLVLSNNRENRVRTFCRALGVAFISRACKPFRRGFRQAAEQLGVPLSQCAVVGDQIFTDVFGANRVGALSCYVQTIDRRLFWINLRYQLERGFIACGRRRMEARANHE